MRKSIVIFLAAVLVLASCGRRKTVEGSAPQEVPQTRNFPAVSAPGMLTEQSEILDYVALHYWDGFAVADKAWLDDSTHVAGVDRTKLEEQIGSYTTILSMVPLDKAVTYIEGFYDKIARMEAKDEGSTAFEETVRMMKKYLYNENSPVRNEDIYGALAAKLAKSPYVAEDMRPSYEFEASSCAKNRVGTQAADFVFVDRSGSEHNLRGIKAPWTLLFFSNPGCTNCAEVTRGLWGSQKIQDMVRGGILAVVNIYIDEDLDAWREHLDDYPSSWMIGYNGTIREDLSYNVRAIPSLYMLDKDKTVMLKDAPAEKILTFIENIEE